MSSSNSKNDDDNDLYEKLKIICRWADTNNKFDATTMEGIRKTYENPPEYYSSGFSEPQRRAIINVFDGYRLRRLSWM